MKNTKFLGLIAIAAVIALAFIACETPIDSPKNKNLSGTISINPSPTVTTGTELTAVYSGTESVSYQWNKGGTAINGEKSTTYTPIEAGSYTVTVSAAGYNSKTSTPVSVTGETLQNLSGNVSISPSENVTTGTELTANYSGSEPVSYQWKKGGENIDGATSSKYTPSEAGSYTVTVSATGYAPRTSIAVTVISPASSNPTTITYTLEQVGGTDGTANSTDIKFTFSVSVDSLSLTAENITVGGAAAKETDATLAGSGTSWTLPITVNAAGPATVQISKTGIAAGQQSVTVYKDGEYAPEYWTITWHLNGGEEGAGAYPTQIVKDTVLAQPSPDPTKGGNTFEGWYSDSGLTTEYDFSAAVTSDLNLYAKWETGSQSAENWTITWDLDDGTAGGTYPTQIEKGAVLTKPADPTKAGYAFDGWYKEEELTTAWNFTTDTITDNITLYAKWNINQYTVTFNSNGGDTVTAQTVDHGGKATEPQNVTRSDGYVVAGWYRDDTSFQNQWNFATDTVTQNITLYAKWGFMPMVFVQGGTFQLGEPDSSINYSDNARPVSNVTVSSFYIGKYEVTQAQWQAVMESLPSSLTTADDRGDTFPVYDVSWYEALVFCNKLSIAEGLTPAYRISNSTNPDDWGTVPYNIYDVTWNAATVDSNSNGYRLPTEAQWEYAAKGGNTGEVFTYAGSNTVGDVAWYAGNSGDNGETANRRSHEVGTKAPNGLGLYDMSGNVSEWCWDRYGNYTSEDKTDPTGASSGSDRVARGGSWNDSATSSAFRSYGEQSNRFAPIGFRVVRP